MENNAIVPTETNEVVKVGNNAITKRARHESDLMDHVFKIGEHGHVILRDSMGSDADIDSAARISYGKGTRSVTEQRGLIRRLIMDNHSSPVEMVEVKLEIKLPIFVMRQLIRHRTHNVNEMSGRYSILPEEMYFPDVENITTQSVTNKQGRQEGIEFINAREARDIMEEACAHSYEAYERLIKLDVARELARIVLPLNLYTHIIWKQNLRNMLHLLGLRLDKHAQLEIRQFAQAMYDICKSIAPNALEAWEDYVFNARSFSRMELKILNATIANKADINNVLLAMVDNPALFGMTKYEVTRFAEKLNFMQSLK